MAKGRVKSANEAGVNWRAGMQNAGPKYTAGIKATTVNPMAAAATPQAMTNYQQGVQRSIDSGKRAAALQATPMETWRNNALTYGASALGTAAQKAGPKYDAAAAKLQNAWQASNAAVQNMPKGGAANGRARMLAAYDAMIAAMGVH